MLQGAIRLFKIRGIEIRADYSWFIILILVTWSFASQAYPSQFEAPKSIYLLLGILTSLLMFISVLLHELAHSFVALSRGINVPRITLFIFGAAAQIETEPKEANDEFFMALAGPATSVLLAVVFGLVHLLVGGWAVDIPPLASLFYWLAYINFFLALFNLIPGFPLDGGRVLRSLIWGASRDAGRATRIASLIGRGVAMLFIFGGILLAFSGNVFNGIWFAFIGWFLLQAATQSSRRQALQDLLAGHVAAQVMWRDCRYISGDTSVSDLVYREIMPTGRRCFPVTEGGNVVGIVTIHNIQAVPTAAWPTTPVSAIMSRAEALKVVAPETPLGNVMEMLGGNGVNQVPVVQEGKFLGMVTREAIMDFLQTKNQLGLDRPR